MNDQPPQSPSPDQPAGQAPQMGARPAAPPPQYAPPPYVIRPRRSVLRGILTGVVVLLLLLSLVLNVYLAVLLAIQLDMPLATKVLHEGEENQTVAVYGVYGMITGRTAEQFNLFCRQVLDDKNVKAVVLRVDTGGGGVSASDQIHDMVKRLRSSGRTVVVSMGGVAASGGYYISAPAEVIFAEETTITGSIGVIAQWFVLKEGLQKLGVKPVVLKSTHAEQWKDEGNWFEEPNPEHRAHLLELLNRMQARFEEVVKAGRGGELKPAAAPGAGEPQGEYEAFNGKVYLAREAKELGLVDEIGYLHQAIDRAAGLARLSKPRVVEYAAREPLLKKLIGVESTPGLTVDAGLLERLETPRILLLWTAD